MGTLERLASTRDASGVLWRIDYWGEVGYLPAVLVSDYDMALLVVQLAVYGGYRVRVVPVKG